MAKSRDAFRTISEVAEWLETPAHVLRFWESKFSQVKPVKRAGGRRYYRPADMELLGGIKRLLHDEGMTIKGVQKILREQGVKHVASLSDPADAQEVIAEAPYIDAPESSETVVPFTPLAQPAAAEPEPEPEPPAPVPEDAAEDTPEPAAEAPVAEPERIAEDAAPEMPDPAPLAEDVSAEAEAPAPAGDAQTDAPAEDGFAGDSTQSPLPDFLKQPLATDADDTASEDEPAAPAAEDPAPAEAAPPAQDTGPSTPAPAEKPLPEHPDLESITVTPGALSALAGLSRLHADDAKAIAPVLDRLRTLQDRLAATKR